jgi:energy-coupling factor transport system permease protein
VSFSQGFVLGQHYPGSSPVHRSSALVKLIATIIVMVTIFVAVNTSEYLPVALFLLSGIMVSRIPARFFLRGIKPILFLIVLTVAVQILFTPGDSIWRFGVVRVTSQGLVLAAFITCRLVLLTLASVLLTASTSPIELTDAISDLLKPFRYIGLPSAEIALVMSIAMRFVPTILEETERIIRAQVSRGARIGEGGLVARMRSFIPILVPLFVSSFRRADDLAIAMEARGFRVNQPRTRYHLRGFHAVDLVILVFSLVTLGAAVLLRVWR